MNTLRIADALQNFDAENGSDHRDIPRQGELRRKNWPRVTRPGRKDGNASHGAHASPQRRARSSGQVASRPYTDVTLRPLKEVQVPKALAGHTRKAPNAQHPGPNGGGGVSRFQNCLPRYSEYHDYINNTDSEVVKLRERVKVKSTDYTCDYDLGGTIGQGTFGKVKKATAKDTGKVVAVKMLGGKGFGTNELKAFLNECDILSEIDHGNVPKLHGVYEGSRKFAMIMEYASGGELFERIQAQGSFNEEAAANITRQLLSVLQYIHEKSIAHRDLKPENILFANADKDLAQAQVKLIDFGFAKRMTGAPVGHSPQPAFTQSSFQTRLGSPNYVAPEILTSKSGYGVEVDVWSLGVILYIMLCGYFPFYHENERELYRQIRRGSFDMPAEDWGHVSEPAKDLVNSMLKTDPRLRVSAQDCLRHPWIAKPGVASKQPFPQASRDKLDMFLDAQKKVPGFRKVMDKVFNPFRTSPGRGDNKGTPKPQQPPPQTQPNSASASQARAAPPDELTPGSVAAFVTPASAPKMAARASLEELETSPLYPGGSAWHKETSAVAPKAGCTGSCAVM